MEITNDTIVTEEDTFSGIFPLEGLEVEVLFREAYTIDELDQIFCDLLNLKGEKLRTAQFASLLGFSIEDNFSDISNKYYKDLAECEIFEQLLQPRIEYNLIEFSKDKKYIQLTFNGKESLTTKFKYRYFKGITVLYHSHQLIAENQNVFAQFFDLKSFIYHKKEIRHVQEIDIKQDSYIAHLAEEQLSYSDNIEIISTELNRILNPSLHSVLFKKNPTSNVSDSEYISVTANGKTSPIINELLNYPANQVYKKEIIRNIVFQNLLNSDNVITHELIKYSTR
jgi:hypothetical protein